MAEVKRFRYEGAVVEFPETLHVVNMDHPDGLKAFRDADRVPPVGGTSIVAEFTIGGAMAGGWGWVLAVLAFCAGATAYSLVWLSDDVEEARK